MQTLPLSLSTAYNGFRNCLMVKQEIKFPRAKFPKQPITPTSFSFRLGSNPQPFLIEGLSLNKKNIGFLLNKNFYEIDPIKNEIRIFNQALARDSVKFTSLLKIGTVLNNLDKNLWEKELAKRSEEKKQNLLIRIAQKKEELRRKKAEEIFKKKQLEIKLRQANQQKLVAINAAKAKQHLAQNKQVVRDLYQAIDLASQFANLGISNIAKDGNIVKFKFHDKNFAINSKGDISVTNHGHKTAMPLDLTKSEIIEKELKPLVFGIRKTIDDIKSKTPQDTFASLKDRRALIA